jgi:hypothetical protein
MMQFNPSDKYASPRHKIDVMIVAAKFMKYLKITFINVSTKIKVEKICKDLTN